MKDAFSRRGSVPVSEPGGVILRRLRPEPSPTLAGLPGLPWHPLPPTLDEMLAGSRPSARVRRAYDPLGQGWPRVQPAISYQPIPAPPLPPPASKRPSRTRPARRPLIAEGLGSIPFLDAGLTDPTSSHLPTPAEAAPAGASVPPAAPPSPDPMVAKEIRRRIELIPVAPSLPRILFSGDEPLTAVGATGVVAEAPPRGSLAEPIATPLSPSESEGVHWPFAASAEVRLTARDPFTVVAHWDRESVVPETSVEEWGRGRWWMRLHQGSAEGPVMTERPAHEAAGTALLPVIEPGRSYVAELGYDSHRSGWHGVAISHPTPTPSDRPTGSAAGSGPVQWGTVAPWEGEPGSGSGVGYVPAPSPSDGEWTEEEIDMESTAAADTASASPLEWSWSWWRGEGHASSGILSGHEAQTATDGGSRVRRRGKAGKPASAESPRSIASEALAEILPPEARRAFWFHVSAEVILHGSTEPGARVTIAGRPVALRPDGSFSFRFAFPDGDFRLPMEAVSADRQDGRKAAVRFLQSTGFEDEVGEHPVSPAWDADLGEWGK